MTLTELETTRIFRVVNWRSYTPFQTMPAKSVSYLMHIGEMGGMIEGISKKRLPQLRQINKYGDIPLCSPPHRFGK